MWRSPVAQRSGGPEVASSNLVIPTKEEMRPTTSYVVRRFFFCYVPFSCPYAAGISGCKFRTSKNTCSLCADCCIPPRRSAAQCCGNRLASADTDSRQKENICKHDVSFGWWQPCAQRLCKRLCVMCSASHDAIAKYQHSDCLTGAKIQQKKAFVKSILRK